MPWLGKADALGRQGTGFLGGQTSPPPPPPTTPSLDFSKPANSQYVPVLAF